MFLHLARTGIISKTPGLIVLNLDNTTEKTVSPGVAQHTGDRIFQRKIRRGIIIILKRGAGGELWQEHGIVIQSIHYFPLKVSWDHILHLKLALETDNLLQRLVLLLQNPGNDSCIPFLAV